MMQVRSIKQILTAVGLTLAVSAVWMPGIARAQDDSVEGNSIWNLEQRVWGSIVSGLGLQDPNAPAIDYRERSPLVVPPSRDLPPPQARTTPRDPAWPKDPDAARAKQAREAKRKPTGNLAGSENHLRPITPDELERGRAAQTSTGSNAPAPGSDSDGKRLLPSELGYFGGLFSGRAFGFGAYQNEVGTFTNEPPRSELTAPPPGYQTPSPAQPYGNTRRVERTQVKEFDPGQP
jgi:hypothetical protein